MRVVEYLEYGHDLFIHCRTCGRDDRWSRDKFLSMPRYLNAEVADLVARLYCSECKGTDLVTGSMNGGYGARGMMHRAAENRARHIRELLTSAGLDPAAYGYPPIA